MGGRLSESSATTAMLGAHAHSGQVCTGVRRHRTHKSRPRGRQTEITSSYLDDGCQEWSTCSVGDATTTGGGVSAMTVSCRVRSCSVDNAAPRVLLSAQMPRLCASHGWGGRYDLITCGRSGQGGCATRRVCGCDFVMVKFVQYSLDIGCPAGCTLAAPDCDHHGLLDTWHNLL
jgi:hypothetical protein